MTDERELYDVVHPGAGAGGDEALARAVLHGLWDRPRALPPALLYDAAGQALFQRITELPEYYLTRREIAILAARAGEVAAALPEGPVEVVELGPGARGEKTLHLLRALASGGRPVRYRPVDVDGSSMAPLAAAIAAELPAVEVRGVVGDFLDGVHYVGRSGGARRLVLFLGATIGNLTRVEARRVLRDVWRGLAPGDLLLVGFDLKKDPARLVAAYDDAQGITRAFTLNLLERLNREVGADFDLDLWDHHVAYDPERGAVRSYLVCVEGQRVRLERLRLAVRFAAGEAIHVEDSHKHSRAEIRALAGAAGFTPVALYEDEAGDFCDALFRALPAAVAGDAGEAGRG